MSPSVIKAPRLCASPSAITKMSGVDGTNRMGVGGGWWRLGERVAAPLYTTTTARYPVG